MSIPTLPSPSSSSSNNSPDSDSNPFTPPPLPRRPSGRRKPAPILSDSFLDLPGTSNAPRTRAGVPPTPPPRPESSLSGQTRQVSSPPRIPPRPLSTSRAHTLAVDPPLTYIDENTYVPTRPLPPPPPRTVGNEKGFSDARQPGRRCYPQTRRGKYVFWGLMAAITVSVAIVIAVCATVIPKSKGSGSGSSGESSAPSGTNGGHALPVSKGGVDIGKPGDIATFGVNSTDHFVMISNRSIAVTRLDPIVNPGSIGTHVHRIHGTSYFTQNLTKASDMINLANCTTAQVQDDKSAYWVPQLYYHFPNGSMVALDMIQTSVYYFQKAPTGVPIYPFPDNYNVVAGNPNRRVVNASDPAQAAVWWVCHRGAEGDLRTNGFPDSQCSIALKSGILFPSCWDGVYADDGDYSTHVAYPTDNVNGYYCPAAFPKKFIAVQFETYFAASDYPFNGAGSKTWVLANGDTSGLGIHGDFMNGWKASTLQGVLDDCRYMNGTIDHPGIYAPAPENCPHLNATVNSAITSSCHLQTPIVNEAVGERVGLTTLPGCNAIWSGNISKPACPNGTVSGGQLNLVKPSVWFNDEPYIV